MDPYQIVSRQSKDFFGFIKQKLAVKRRLERPGKAQTPMAEPQPLTDNQPDV